jgi:hypothetical protein
MASKDEDMMLTELSGDIDEAMYKWLTTYEIPALNLTAVILARLTWLAKQGDYKEDFVRLLESPKHILAGEDEEKVVH